jgi:hypothetical protein
MKKIPVGHTAYAAALSISGAAVSVERVRCLSSDKERTLWHLAARGGPGHETWDIARIHQDLRTGDLAAREPWHPVLDALRAIEARSHLLQWRATGEGCHLVRGEGDERTRRWRLVPGAPRLVPGARARVRGVATASALAVLGAEPVGLLAGGIYEFADAGEDHGAGAWMVSSFLGRLAAGTVGDSEAWWGLFYGAENMERLVAAAKSAAPLVDLAAMRGTHRALIPENASGKLLDRVRKWLVE